MYSDATQKVNDWLAAQTTEYENQLFVAQSLGDTEAIAALEGGLDAVRKTAETMKAEIAGILGQDMADLGLMAVGSYDEAIRLAYDDAFSQAGSPLYRFFSLTEMDVQAVADKNVPKGETGAQGEKGDTGATGADGKSAYSYAQDGGYTGTEAEFAAKLAAESIDKALFVVNITTTDGVTYSADKTFDEITQAYNEGKYNIVAVWDGLIMPLSEITESVRAIFGCISGNDSFLITITYDNKVREEGMLLATIHDKLPNPYPLIFTGAVSGTYDGSSAKTIEIPSGGGSSGSYFGVYTVEEDVSQYRIPFEVSRYRHIVIGVNQPSNQASLTIGFVIDGLVGSTAKEGGVSSRTYFMFDVIEWTPGTLTSGGKYEILGYSRRNNNPNASVLLKADVQYVTTEENSLIVSGNDGVVISQGTIITITAIP